MQLRNSCFGNGCFGTKFNAYEIDIVAENELNDEAVFIEVKRKEDNFDAIALNEKVDVFTRATGKFKDYTVSQKGLSMTDM